MRVIVVGRTRARGQSHPSIIAAQYPHGVVIKVPRPLGFGESLNVLERTAAQCGEHRTSTARRVEFDEWVRFGFKDAEAAYTFRGEAEKIVPGLVEPPDEEWKR